MKIEINIEKKHAMIFTLFSVLLLGGLFVTAFGGTNPALLGHSAGELIVNSASIVDGSITGSDVGSDTLTGTNINEASLGTVPTAGSAQACNNDGTCEMNAGSVSGTLSANTLSASTFTGGGYTGSSYVANIGTPLTIQDGGGGGGAADIDKAGTSLELETDVGGNVGINTRLLIGATGGAAEVLDVFGNGRFSGSITVASCTGCSTIAEMMEISDIQEGDVVCIDATSGRLEKCAADKSLLVQGIATTHAEQVLNRACGGENNTMLLGGNESSWMHRASCAGWYPVAIAGIHEFTKVHCLRSDGSALQFGDRLVTARDGMLRPLASNEQGGDAVVAVARTVCGQGKQTGVIHALLR